MDAITVSKGTIDITAFPGGIDCDISAAIPKELLPESRWGKDSYLHGDSHWRFCDKLFLRFRGRATVKEYADAFEKIGNRFLTWAHYLRKCEVP